jgi:hypothetical protein
LAEGNYNVTSLHLQCDEEPLQQIHDVENDAHIEELHDVEAETHGYEGEEGMLSKNLYRKLQLHLLKGVVHKRPLQQERSQ